MSGSAVVVEADTGATYGTTPPESASSVSRLIQKPGSHMTSFAVLSCITGIIVGLIAAPYWPRSAGWIGVGVAACLVVLGVVLAIRSHRQVSSMRRLDRLLFAAVENPKSLSNERVSAISSHAASKSLRPSDKDYVSKLAYLSALAKIIEDRRVDDDELKLLTQLEAALDLPEDFTNQTRLEVYRTEYFEAVSDHELTDGEEATLEHLRRQLSIPDDSITEELEYLDELRELRRITSGDLPEIDVQVQLRRGETCHYSGVGRLLKSKIQQSFQRDGQKYQVRGLEIDKEGELLVTNKRILLIHTGTSSIPLAKILDIEVDWDQKLLSITKDGAAKLVLLTTPGASEVGAIVSNLTSH